MLDKSKLKDSIFKGLKKIYLRRAEDATTGDENKNPEEIIEEIATDISNVVADAVDSYVKEGDIVVDGTIIQVTSPSGFCTVTPLNRAKIK